MNPLMYSTMQYTKAHLSAVPCSRVHFRLALKKWNLVYEGNYFCWVNPGAYTLD